MRTRTWRGRTGGVVSHGQSQVAAGALAALVALAGCTSTIEDGTPVDVSANALCTGVQLNRMPNTQVVTGSLTLQASGTTCGPTETPRYRFQYRRNTTAGSVTGQPAWLTLQNWSLSPTATLDATVLASGEYALRVQAHAAVNGNSVDSFDTDIVMLNDVCPSVTLNASPSGTSNPPGTLFTLTGLATCTGSTPAQYRFARRAVGNLNNPVQLQDWSTDADLTWTPLVGDWEVFVYARSGTNTTIESQQTILVKQAGHVCSGLTLGLTPGTEALTGATVTESASASCTGSTPRFQFSMRPLGSPTWTILRAWGNSATNNWNTTGRPEGPYELRAEVRANDFAGPPQDTVIRSYTLGRYCGTTSFTTSVPSPQPLGTSITMNATASCVLGTPEYRFSMLAPGGGGYTLLRDWGGSSFTITTEPTATGLHTLRVETRAATSSGPVQATFTSDFNLTCAAGAACTDAAQVSAGWDHSCATTVGGALYCWGDNDYGQVGDGTTTSSNVPVRVGTDTNWASVVTGFFASCGVRTDGTLWCWGWNGAGQLGDGTLNDSLVPVQVGTDTDWDSVDLGYYHACGSRTGGTLWCWGYNGDGELGDGTATDSLDPVQVGTDTDWASVSAGGFHNCGVRTDSSLWCWGWNASGEVGIGNTTQQNAPVRVGTDTDWASVTGGGAHTCGVRSSGTLWCWGDNSVGALGDGTVVSQSSPVQTGTDTDWAIAAGGGLHTCALRTAGALWCWGHNDYGAVGDGSVITRSSPTQVGTNTGWTSITAGDYFSGGVNSGLAFFWGDNSRGQLGDNTTTEQHAPGASVTFP